MPRGAVWCLVFFACVELGFRFLPRSFFLQFDQSDYEGDAKSDYTAVELAVSALRPADVIVVGTSRAREAVQSPDLELQLGRSIPGKLSVRNYGTAGGRVNVWLALVERLIRTGKQPRVLVVVLDGSDFRDPEPLDDRYRLLDLGGLPADIARNGWPDEADMTSVLGNSIPLRMVRARPTLSYRLVQRGDDMSVGRARRSDAAFGGTTGWARGYTRAVSRGQTPAFKTRKAGIRSVRRGYVIYERGLDRLRELVNMATAAGVNVVLAQMPESPLVSSAARVKQARARLQGEMRVLAGHDRTWVWTSDMAAQQFGKLDYRDPSHLNARGALRFVEQIAPLVTEAARASRP